MGIWIYRGMKRTGNGKRADIKNLSLKNLKDDYLKRITIYFINNICRNKLYQHSRMD